MARKKEGDAIVAVADEAAEVPGVPELPVVETPEGLEPIPDTPEPVAIEGSELEPGLEGGGAPDEGVDDAPVPKKRRKRRQKVVEPVAVDAGPSPEQVKGLRQALHVTFGMGSGMLAQSLGAHWTLPEQEHNALSDVWTTALLPYMGNVSKHMPLIAAIIVTAGVVVPRVVTDAKIRRGELQKVEVAP